MKFPCAMNRSDRFAFKTNSFMIAVACSVLANFSAHAETPDFLRDVAPIFETHCLKCHSKNVSKGEISLSTAQDVFTQQYVLPGDADSSYLIDLVTSQAGRPPQMPKTGDALTAAEVRTLKQWIEDGAKWPKNAILRERSRVDQSWWSLQPLKFQPAEVTDSLPPAWRTNPIDRYVFARLEKAGLRPNPPADRRVLIRRATYDLIGLPPTPREVEEFVNSRDPQAYEKLIDRLLESPHYGERWGRHWLDVVRFGESNGFERNVIINNLWPFRDYVIQSFNDDKPFNQFIREHLAGDVFGRGNPEQETGTAFLVAGPYDDVGNQDAAQAAQIRANTIDEMIRATTEAFLGLTVGCARCHDHKFDPILQEDYYSLYATFAGVRHGSRTLGTPQQQASRAQALKPLEQRRQHLVQQRDQLIQTIHQRALAKLKTYEQRWKRPAVNRLGTTEEFPPVSAKFVRLISEGQDVNPANRSSFGIDEFEVFSTSQPGRNVALASTGAKASGAARRIEDFPGAYGPHLAIDGKLGARFLAVGGQLTIQLARPLEINRVVFSSARGETTPSHRKFTFVGEYRIEVSLDGENWTVVATSHDRQPVNPAHRDHRLRHLETTTAERKQLAEWNRQISLVNQVIAALPQLKNVFIGFRDAPGVNGPFHVFLGGSPQRRGEVVHPRGLSFVSHVIEPYKLKSDATEAVRRQALADWIVNSANPLTPRVLANRIWHYHFGIGIVDTPSDFGSMGGQPTHPQLLDWLADRLIKNQWKVKPLHRTIMLSQTYRQASDWRAQAAALDGTSRLLWRFPPRRLSAEEIRDSILAISGKLNRKPGGPGFRLYQFLQDNVCTYLPLEKHGPETYRRAVYHQNARASVVDLMTDFDQPDCAFSTARRASTTTPLQALTMLNHQFTLDMSAALAQRVQDLAGDDVMRQIRYAWQYCYQRDPTSEEVDTCKQFLQSNTLTALCRVLLNTSEFIYVK